MALEKGVRTPSMDEKVRQAIFRQVENEPFARKFGLRLVDLGGGYSKEAERNKAKEGAQVLLRFTPKEQALGRACWVQE